MNTTLDWEALKSIKFSYLVPFDSLLTPDELEDFFVRLEKIYHNMLHADPMLSYLGSKPEHLFKRSESLPEHANASFFRAAFDSEEYAISHSGFKSAVKHALVNQNPSVRSSTPSYLR